MTFFKISARRSVAIASLFVAALGIAPGTASAAGFFEQLFGAPAEQTRAPVQYEALPSDVAPVETYRTRRVVEHDEKPVLQKPTDLMHDRTLRAGDPVMMKDGVHIYAGPESGHHSTKQFVALTSAHVSPKTRGALVAVDLSHRDPAEYAPVQEGRSVAGETDVAADGPKLTAGYKITDARGQSVRYVGP